MVVVSTVMVNSSVTVSMTRARLANGVADTRAMKEERAIMLVLFILYGGVGVNMWDEDCIQCCDPIVWLGRVNVFQCWCRHVG